MIGALGALVGAAIPARIPAIVTTTVLGSAYFLLINLARFAPLDDAGRAVRRNRPPGRAAAADHRLLVPRGCFPARPRLSRRHEPINRASVG